jgi:hypothetical protein
MRVVRVRARALAQRCFACVGIGLAAVFAWAAAWQVLHPWQVVFHADFYGTLSHRAVAAVDVAAAACIGAASHALLRATSSVDAQRAAGRQLAVSACVALATSAFWSVAWLRRAVTR